MYGYRRHWDLPVILPGYARKITGTGPAVRIILHSRQRGCVNHKTLRGGRDSYRLPHFPAFTTNHGEPETGKPFRGRDLRGNGEDEEPVWEAGRRAPRLPYSSQTTINGSR